MTIDRIDPLKGYEPGNLQVLTLSENSRKRWVDYWRSLEGYPPGEREDLQDLEPLPF